MATSVDGIPQTKNGNPIPGQFAYSAVHDLSVNQYTYVIPISSDWRYPNTRVKIAAHAVVSKPGIDEEVQAKEGAWAAGMQFAGANWATYFNYVRDLSAPETCALINANPDTVVLDVRSPAAFATGHLSGAININYLATPSPATFASAVDQLDKSVTYLVYCGSGTNGGKAAAIMRNLGCVEVYNLAGGYTAWLAGGGCPTQ